MRILNEQQENLLKRERSLLGDLRVALVQFDATSEDQQTLAESIQQLDELFLLVIVGEFNSGKSAFINALLGQKLLKEGVTPTTTQINILRFGETMDRSVTSEHEHILSLPVDLLKELSIVDTPGTNAIIREHEAITSKFVPRSDLVLFITSADRPFTESERAFLEHIRDWGKKVIIVINKIDILETNDDLKQIEDFVSQSARNLLGITPETFPVSARLALHAKQGEPDRWEASRFEALEAYIRQTLDETSRLRLKFLNPLGVGSHLTKRYLNVTQSRLDLLREDFQMLSDIEMQLDIYQEDMQRDFAFRMSDIEKILFEMEQRGQDYFDETFRLARVFDLVSKERIRQEFEQQVVSDVPEQIDRKVAEMIDWLVDSDLHRWQAVNDHLAERRRVHQERIVGEPSIGSFNYDRDRLIDAVGRQAQRVVESYDRSNEAQAIARGAQEAVAASALLEAGAVSLGAIIAVVTTTMAADVTGVLLASLLAALGLFIIPARRRIAKNEMRKKIASLREQLIGTLRTQFEKEIYRSQNQLKDAIAPYTRFVRAERSKLEDTQNILNEIAVNLNQLKVTIEEIL